MSPRNDTGKGGHSHYKRWLPTKREYIKGKCGRCGIETSGEFCADCKVVDPEMTKGGLTAPEMYKKRTKWVDEFLAFDKEIRRVSSPSAVNRDYSKKRIRDREKRNAEKEGCGEAGAVSVTVAGEEANVPGTHDGADGIRPCAEPVEVPATVLPPDCPPQE